MTGSPAEASTYRVSLDREACEGIFACLVRDDRFEEGRDGLAVLAGEEVTGPEAEITATFEDSQYERAKQAARACPVDAIEVAEVTDE